MKIKHLAMLLPTALMAFTQHGEEIAAVKEVKKETKPVEVKPPFIEYNNRMVVFSLGYQSYERTQPDALYWGLLGYLTNTINQDGDTHPFLQAEFRLGYNYFYSGKHHLTPYAGIGYINDFRKWHRHHSLSTEGEVVFGEVGFLYDHEFNRLINFGINLKGLVGGVINEERHNKDFGDGAVYGFDVGVPLTFRFGRNRHWDFRFEPFNVYLRSGSHNHNYFGFRNAFAYRF